MSIVQLRRYRNINGNHNLKTEAYSRTDTLADHVHDIAKHQLIPQVAKMQENAIKSDRRKVYFYARKRVGLRCSCVDADDVPEGNCQVCFKTGIVGGFNKFGTHMEVFSAASSFAARGIIVDYTAKPHYFALAPNALDGTVIFKFPVKHNIKKIDLLKTNEYQPIGTQVTYEIWDGLDWVTLSNDTFKMGLSKSEIKIRVTMVRTNLELRSPKFSSIFFRYNIISELRLDTDWPHAKDSRALTEFGIQSNWTVLDVNISNIIRKITPEDFMFRIDRNEVWKIISSDKFDQLEINTGHNLDVRLVQPYEVYRKFPL